MQVWSGKLIDPMRLKPDDVDPNDIGRALSMICRFGGHVARHYSVAEHSLLVASLAPQEYALEALLHDAAEAYLGDIIRPLKRLRAFDAYRVAERAVEETIRVHFGLADVHAVREADEIALAIERRDLLVPCRVEDEHWWEGLPTPPPNRFIPRTAMEPAEIECHWLRAVGIATLCRARRRTA